MSILKWLLGLNWRTGLAGWTVILAAIGRIGLAWKARDFNAIMEDGQLILTTVLAIATGLGLIKAKDQNVTGTGTAAKTLDASSGTLTNREGAVVGKQSVTP